jgi:uncharacterized protein YjiS (DUF1127 family)
MTMLLPTQSPTAPSLRRIVLFNAARLRRIVNGWVGALIARYERHAAMAALRHLDDRELKDIGLYRGEIDDAIARASQARLQRRHFF